MQGRDLWCICSISQLIRRDGNHQHFVKTLWDGSCRFLLKLVQNDVGITHYCSATLLSACAGLRLRRMKIGWLASVTSRKYGCWGQDVTFSWLFLTRLASCDISIGTTSKPLKSVVFWRQYNKSCLLTVFICAAHSRIQMVLHGSISVGENCRSWTSSSKLEKGAESCLATPQSSTWVQYAQICKQKFKTE